MKITKLVIRSLSGHFESDGEFWEERLVRPIDIYPEYANEKHENWSLQKNNNVSTNSIFVEIHTDENIYGTAGPIDSLQADVIEKPKQTNKQRKKIQNDCIREDCKPTSKT